MVTEVRSSPSSLALQGCASYRVAISAMEYFAPMAGSSVWYRLVGVGQLCCLPEGPNWIKKRLYV